MKGNHRGRPCTRLSRVFELGLTLPRGVTVFVGVCLALRSGKLLNPAQTKAYNLGGAKGSNEIELGAQGSPPSPLLPSSLCLFPLTQFPQVSP